MLKIKTFSQVVVRTFIIAVWLIIAFFSAEGQCPNPVTPCNASHQTTIDLSTIPQCGSGTISIEGDIQGSQTDCLGTANASWKCHQFTITRPVGSLTQQFSLNIGQGNGCTGELDATYSIINGVCSQLSNGGSGTTITFSFPIGVNSMVLDLCLNSSAFVTICNLCNQPPPCTSLPQCNLADISVSGCKSNVPDASTNPSTVFTNTGNCSAMLQLSHTDVGDTSFCSVPAGVNFVRTYTLSFFDGTDYIPYQMCVQNIHVVPASGVPVITTCAVTRNIQGCNTGAITDPVFSTTTATSTEAVFEDATNQGNSSNSCGSASVKYIDVATGSCPIIVTRKWTISDDCGHSATCNQTISVNDTSAPTISACAVTRTIEGCTTTGSIFGPPFSTTTAVSSEAVFEDATNQGNTSDACGIISVKYIDVAVGTCPTVVTRKWTVSDACGNSSTCLQTINVGDSAPPAILACAGIRNIEGCNVSSITNPPYSATSAGSTEAEFESAPNLGNVSDACGITSVTYIDLATGTCPIVVTRKWTVSDACGRSSTCNQTINVNDSTNPVIMACAATRNIDGCDASNIINPPFSATLALSSEAVFENAPNNGNASDACGITSVTYIDVITGTCPIVLTRKWTVSDACGHSATCHQTINVNDTTNPAIIACAQTRNVEGCNTGAITGPPFSSITAASTEAAFESAPNTGNASDACGITSVTYIDVTTGTCPIVVNRKWTVSDACGHSATCNQVINVNDTTDPVITACAVTRNIEGCSLAAITSPPYSTLPTVSSEVMFESAPNNGNVSDACGISSVTYIDVATGTCPIAVIRKWTVTDACGHSATCHQTINVDDTISPFITACAVTRNIEGCSVSAIANPPFSATLAVSSENVFESAPNNGNTSDACGINSVTYIDIAAGTCPTIVSRKWTVSDACGNSTTCIQTINIDDTTNPVITFCPADLVLNCDPEANNVAIILAWLATATATDACDGNVMINYSYDGISIPEFTCEGLQGGGLHILITATDDCGNTATCTATVSKPCFNIEAEVYIEGATIDLNGANTYSLPMRTTLNDVRVLPGQTLVDPFIGIKYSPPGQPFSGPPWNYPGTEGDLFDSGGNPMMGNAGYPPTVVDWVLVSLRNDSAGTGGVVCQAAALLHNDGHLQFVQPLDCCDIHENNDYYIVIEHRDHLIVMSDIKVSFITHKLLFDFRFHQSYIDDPFNLGIFAREKEIIPGKFAMFTGDGEQALNPLSDTNINADDKSTWFNQNSQVGSYRLGDYNLNGDTNLNDRVVWERNNPRFSSVPRD